MNRNFVKNFLKISLKMTMNKSQECQENFLEI